jgi:hypothetical protein
MSQARGMFDYNMGQDHSRLLGTDNDTVCTDSKYTNGEYRTFSRCAGTYSSGSSCNIHT